MGWLVVGGRHLGCGDSGVAATVYVWGALAGCGGCVARWGVAARGVAAPAFAVTIRDQKSNNLAPRGIDTAAASP
jgi:hypothetical protein